MEQEETLELMTCVKADSVSHEINLKEEKKMETKRLTKSDDNRVLCGVCGGIGEYFNIDPVVIRLLWVVFCCLGGSGIIAYIIAAIIIPSKTVS